VKRTQLRRASKAKVNWQRQYAAAKADRMRAMIAERGYVYCERCGIIIEDGVLGDGHHPDGQNGTLILHFFIVCRLARGGGCHDFIHITNPNAAREEGWLRAKNAQPNTRTMPKTLTPKNTLIIEPALCTTRDAEKLRQRCINGAEELQGALLEMHEKRAWRALTNPKTGQFYETFRDFIDIELSHRIGAESTIYRLLDQAEVSRNVGAQVPQSHAAVIKALPAPAQREVIAEAKKEAKESGKDAATVEIVKDITRRYRGANGSQAERKEPPTITLPSEAETKKRNTMLDRVEKICGKDLRKAIATDTIKLKTADLKLFTELKDPQMIGVGRLLAVQWKVKDAIQSLSKMPNAQTRAAEFINHAIADGGEWEGVIDGWTFTIKGNKRK
jgi:hypothetical protein